MKTFVIILALALVGCIGYFVGVMQPASTPQTPPPVQYEPMPKPSGGDIPHMTPDQVIYAARAYSPGDVIKGFQVWWEVKYEGNHIWKVTKRYALDGIAGKWRFNELTGEFSEP